jgi:hypothetical protein
VDGPHDAGQAGGHWEGNSWVADPYVSDPGVQPGKTQTQFEGLDFTKRGPAEQQWIDQKGFYNTPLFGETNAQRLVAEAKKPEQTNNSQNWLDAMSGRMPSINTDPGFGSYFDTAKSRAQESINRAAAATGSYGSSSANDQVSRAFTDLDGQRALKEADYNLSRLAEQRAWEALGGQLSGQADQQTITNSKDDQDWMALLSKLGIDASRLGLDRINAAIDAAHVAGADERTRGRDAIGDQTMSGDRFAELIKSILGTGLDNDADFLGVVDSGGVAKGDAGVVNENNNAHTTADGIKTAYSVYTDPGASWNQP